MSTQPATTLYTALLAAQRQMGPVKKDAKNPAFRSNYATLGSVLNTIEGPLWENGLLMVQRFEGAFLITEIIHAASGEKLTSMVPIVSKDETDPQKVGSAISYYRRYSLLALLGLTPEEDDDGNSAAQPARNTPRPAPAPQPRPAPAQAPAASGNGKVEASDDAPNPHPAGSVEAVLWDARLLANAGHTVAEVWQFLTSRQKALGEDWDTVVAEWKTIKADIVKRQQPAAIAG